MESKQVERPIKKKTKSQVERETPFIKPEDCPGAVIEYFNKTRKADYLAFREIMQEELASVKKFMVIAADNRVWLIVLSFVVFGVVLILWFHISNKVPI